MESNGYPLDEVTVLQVSRWGNNPAHRRPAAIVQALDPKEGEHVEVHPAGRRSLEIARKPAARALAARLREYRGRLPADFKRARPDRAE